MKLSSVFEQSFASYGRVLSGLDCAGLYQVMEKIPMPPSGTSYAPSLPDLEASMVRSELENGVYGCMPVQVGMCWGHNTKLNCLEYHRDSEVNIGSSEFILLLAHEWEIHDGVLDTACVRAFKVPAGTAVELYATTLHYAPCQVSSKGFRVAIALPRGTNEPLPESAIRRGEGRLLTARNKWLLAHPESDEAKTGAVIGLAGANLDIAQDL